MAVKVTDNTVQFEHKVTQKSSLFLREFAEQVVNVAQPNTPKDRGNLARDVVKQVLALKGKIKWDKVYASYQERGMRRDGTHRVRNYTTPGTGPHFAKNAINTVVKRESQIMRKVGLI